MKKSSLLTLFFIAIFAHLASAQIGVKAGINMAAAGSYGNSEEGETFSYKPGFQLGVFYDYPVSETFSILTELNYLRTGTVSKKDYMLSQFPVSDAEGNVLGLGDYSINQEITANQHYINIPILAKFNTGSISYYIGPNIGFLLSSKGDINRTIGIDLGGNAIPGPTTEQDVDFLDYDSFRNIFIVVPEEDGNFLNSFTAGINLGVAYNINENLFIDLRISQELTDLTNNHYDNSIYPNSSYTFESRDDTDRSLSFQLSVAYQFGGTMEGKY